MPEEMQSQVTSEAPKETKSTNPLAFLSYIGLLFLIPMLVAKDDEFVKFHVKQGITLFIAEVITWFIWLIPVIGLIIGWLASICWLILSILGIVNVLKAEKKPLPLIGKFANNWKI